MTDEERAEALEKIGRIRDALRPRLADVVHCVENVLRIEFGLGFKSERLVDGPVQWIWKDLNYESVGGERYMVLSESGSPETPGHPLLTIRQSYSSRLDMWVTTTGLVMGDSEAEIVRSIVSHLANHKGALAGYRLAMISMIKGGGDPLVGMAAADSLADQVSAIPLRDAREVMDEVGDRMDPDPKDVN